MMSWNSNTDETLRIMRDSHIKFRLTNVHFVVFKQYLVNSFREMNFKEKHVLFEFIFFRFSWLLNEWMDIDVASQIKIH